MDKDKDRVRCNSARAVTPAMLIVIGFLDFRPTKFRAPGAWKSSKGVTYCDLIHTSKPQARLFVCPVTLAQFPGP